MHLVKQLTTDVDEGVILRGGALQEEGIKVQNRFHCLGSQGQFDTEHPDWDRVGFTPIREQFAPDLGLSSIACYHESCAFCTAVFKVRYHGLGIVANVLKTLIPLGLKLTNRARNAK